MLCYLGCRIHVYVSTPPFQEEVLVVFLSFAQVSSLYIVIVIMSNKVQLRTMSGEFVAKSARQGTKAIRETKLKIVQNPLLTNRSHFLQKKNTAMDSLLDKHR